MRFAIAVFTLGLAAPAVAQPSLEVVEQVETGSMPWSVTVSPDGDTLYVSHVGLRNRPNVWRYDADSLEVQDKAKLHGHAVESILTSDALYVSDSREHHIRVVDPRTMKVERSIATRKIPKDFALSRAGVLYVAHWGANGLGAYDAASGKELGFVRTGRHARGATLSPDGDTVYVMNFSNGTVSVVDTDGLKVRKQIRACKNPRHGAITNDQRWLLVTCHGDARVLVIDRRDHTIARRLKIGRGPKTIALSRDGAYAFTADEDSDTVTAIDLKTWDTRTQKVPANGPCGITVAPDDKTIYVTAKNSHEMVVLRRDDTVAER